MKRLLGALVALGVLAAGAVEARAEFADSPVVATTAGSFSGTTTATTAAVNSNDGVFVLNLTAGTTPSTLTLQVNFATATSVPRVLIYTGGVTGAFLSAVTFTNASLQTDTWSGGTATTGALAASSANGFSFGSGAYAFTSSGGGSTNFNQVLMTFQFPASGTGLAIDAIANPEPGTLALFGLGAAGLGGLAWRRRRARAAAQPA